MFFEPNLSESIYLCDFDATYIELLFTFGQRVILNEKSWSLNHVL